MIRDKKGPRAASCRREGSSTRALLKTRERKKIKIKIKKLEKGMAMIFVPTMVKQRLKTASAFCQVHVYLETFTPPPKNE